MTETLRERTETEHLILSIARNHISAGCCTFLCVAIDDAVRQMRRDWMPGCCYTPRTTLDAKKRLHRRIMSALGSSVSLGGWQLEHNILRSPDQRRRDRLEWIDAMLTGHADTLVYFPR